MLSLCGIKGSINKEQKSSAVRLGQWLLGVVPANRDLAVCAPHYGELGHIKWCSGHTKTLQFIPKLTSDLSPTGAAFPKEFYSLFLVCLKYH